MTWLRRLRVWFVGQVRRVEGAYPRGVGTRVRSFGMSAIVVAVAERREPIQPPPPIFDLLLAILFAWGGWKVWQKGRGWRSGAVILWLFALGGIYTFSRSF